MDASDKESRWLKMHGITTWGGFRLNPRFNKTSSNATAPAKTEMSSHRHIPSTNPTIKDQHRLDDIRLNSWFNQTDSNDSHISERHSQKSAYRHTFEKKKKRGRDGKIRPSISEQIVYGRRRRDRREKTACTPEGTV